MSMQWEVAFWQLADFIHQDQREAMYQKLLANRLRTEEMTTPMQTCANCRHWRWDHNGPDPSEGSLQFTAGECRRHAPARSAEPQLWPGNMLHRVWAVTAGSDWCGAGRDARMSLSDMSIATAHAPDAGVLRNLAGWLLLALLVGVLAIDYFVLYKRGKPTISQWLKRKTAHPIALKVLGIGLLGLLLYHLFFGGPI